MSHNITIRENGKPEIAYTGETPWHKLGTKLEIGAPIEVWKEQAGLDWTAEMGSVLFQPNDLGDIHDFPSKKVIYRSDNKVPLAVVGHGFKIVQPGDILEFFRDLIAINGMQLNTAGSLYNGTRIWALAETNRVGEVLKGDVVKAHLLLITALDGSMSTIARFVSQRVVCANTLAIALAEDCKNVIRTTHRSKFDASKVKIDLGLIDKSWSDFMSNLNRLANHSMSLVEVGAFFKKTFYNPEVEASEQSRSAVKCVNDVMDLYQYGAGHEMGAGTAWGALNAITNHFTHGTGRKSSSSQFLDSYLGVSNDVKKTAYEDLLALT